MRFLRRETLSVHIKKNKKKRACNIKLPITPQLQENLLFSSIEILNTEY